MFDSDPLLTSFDSEKKNTFLKTEFRMSEEWGTLWYITELGPPQIALGKPLNSNPRFEIKSVRT